jgi:glutamate-ammonia-ligase adenylyltransferase
MVTALTAPTAEGKLYEVDMRLRPSGNQGPVATSLESFAAYQKDEAWTWEHLALTRARPVAGAAEIGAEVERIRLAVLTARRDAAKTIADVAEMRARIAAAKGAGLGPLEAKLGPGRQQDIELVAQCAAVLGPGAPRHVGEQLAQGAEIGWFTTAEAALMHDAHGLFWRLSAAAKLLTGETLSLDAVGQGGRAFLLRETGFESAEALEAGLEARALAAENAIEAALARLPGEAGP